MFEWRLVDIKPISGGKCYLNRVWHLGFGNQAKNRFLKMLKLFCVVLQVGRPFHVDINMEETVSDLKKKIKEEVRNSIACDADEIQLYLAFKQGVWLSDEDSVFGEIKKVDPSNMLVSYMNDITCMNPIKRLSHYFKDNSPSVDRIHVLVVPRSQSERSGYLQSKKRKIQHLKDELPAPSSFAKCRGKYSWIRMLRQLDGQIECHRIATSNENTPIPLVLLHEAFAKFESNWTTIDYGTSDCDFIVQFCKSMSDGYETEEPLAANARDLLGSYLLSECPAGAAITPTVVHGSISDGTYLFGKVLLLNLEVKVQKGDGGGDPTMQNIGYYVNNLPNQVDRAMPCILLDICGPLLSVFGIVNVGDDCILCEPLAPSMPLLYFDNVGLMTMLIRICVSLKVALKELTSSHDGGPSSGIERCRFPYHDSATIDGAKVQIAYCERLVRYVFAARVVQSGRDVIVKFSKHYGRKVHEFCADAGFAPRLLHFEVLPSNWVFVVMEKLDLLPVSRAPVQAIEIRDKVLNILNRLETARLVHGDLREGNLFWDSSNKRVVLIDFDWSGPDGAVVYPPFMNSNIMWPPGAETNKPLRIQHDEWWVNHFPPNLD